MLAIATLSAWRLKVSSVRAATSASRMVDCCPKRCVGSTFVVILCHAPHSSTTSFTRCSRSLSHHLPLGSDERLHAVGTAQQVVPGRFVEGEGLTVGGA